VRWVRANAKKYGINPDKIGVIGESAGGHLAAIMGTSGGDPYLEGNGPCSEYSSRVQAVVDNFGPIDLLTLKDTPSPMDPNPAMGPIAGWLGKPALEVPELAKKANPVTYIDPGDPPVLLVHGEKDSLVPVTQSELFYNALTGAGVKAKLVRVKNAGHGFEAEPKGSTISPGADEITTIQMNWFKEVLK
jgi:acetyl esterase/lipase